MKKWEMLVNEVQGNATRLKVAGTTAVMVALPSMTAFAAEGDAANVLDAELMAVITNGFTSLAITATAVIGIAITTGITIVGMSAGAKFAMKKAKGLLSNAA